MFRTPRKKNYNTYFLQDLHLNEKEEILIQSQRGTQAFFQLSWNNSKLVAILLNDNFECKIRNVHKDESDNYLKVDTTVGNVNLPLVNINSLN